MSDRAVVLLSGGLDSATTATQAAREGFELHALSFDYGQRHAAELAAARRVADSIPVAEHKTVQVDLRSFGGSALTDEIPVPKGRDATEIATGIPVTYVPARNTIFLSFALAWAEVLGAVDIFIGVNALDYSGYPDCRPEYLEAFERLASLATKAGVEGSRPLRIHAPLMDLTKSDIISLGVSLGVDYAQTVSCYEATENGEACGNCDSCLLRRRGFSEAGIPDPTRYQAQLAG
jgi:7-cyano-7-deazaguanine synthase